jgi:two-component system sensor histidine kinase VicK
VDLERLLSDSMVEHSIIAGKHSIGLDLALQLPLPVVSLDSRRIHQVLDNLLSNALKFTQDGGHIELGAQRGDCNQVKIWVKDTGVGIPQSEISLIFEKYRQVSNHNRSSSLGTGLGLAICTKIVEAHGGAIWVESEEKKGTTFFFSLCVDAQDA